jgi:hypothetical protein
MIADLIEKIQQHPDWGNIAKEQAQKILEHGEIFTVGRDGTIIIKQRPGRPLVPVDDLYMLVSYLVESLSLFTPVVVEVNNTLDLQAKHIGITKSLRELFNAMQQRGMISGNYDPEAPVGATWSKKIGNIYRAVEDLFEIIQYPAKPDFKGARRQLILSFLEHAPTASNTLIADKIIIILRDVIDLPENMLPSHSTLRQQVADLRRKNKLKGNIIPFPKS